MSSLSSRSLFNSLSTRHLTMDFMGGLTAAVVALPLALAFGVASGAGPAAGMYGAIFVGFFAAIFGGTSRQISGPTGPMTVVMASVFASLVAKHPDTGLLLAFSAVILAGLIQIAFGLLKLGRYFILVPYPVISGFMSGIGVIIIILQLGPLLGHSGSATLIDAIKSIPSWISHANGFALLLGVVSLSVAFLWPSKLGKYCPAPLAALIIGSLVYLLFLKPDSVAIIGDIPSGFPQFQMPIVSFDVLGEIFYAALLLAVLGTIDSLLTALVADNLTHDYHDSDKELIGQGIGNTIAGFFGGLPGAGATMRTVINIRAGGVTGYSGAIHSLVLLFIMLGAGQYAAHIPLAVLAGILITVGINIIDWAFLKRISKLPWLTVALMLTVLLMTVFVDLITAVLVGVFLSNLITVDRLTNIQLESVHLSNGDNSIGSGLATDEQWLKDRHGQVTLLQLDGPLSFGVGRGLRQRLANFVSHKIMVIDLSAAHLVGTTTSMILDDLIRGESAEGRQVLLVGMSDKVKGDLARLGTLTVLNEACLLASLPEAFQQADQRLK